jgi:hypothetical protein
MKRLKVQDALLEIKCPACNGTGFPNVKQPVELGRKIYPPPCKDSAGNGRLRANGLTNH